jgi:signal transduction histidine kinase
LDTSHSALQEAHEQLGSYARQVELLTATRERNHIAREIHDTVGHTMTSLLVQLQVARKLQAKDPSGSQEALLRCEELARSALQEMRLSVRTLQAEGESAVSLLDALRNLIADFSQLSEMETELQVQGLPSRVPTTLEPALYRIIQESLTNAKRHGQAASARVFLECTAEEVRLEIVDDGLGSGDFAPGFGLMQMRERVSEQGGNLSFSSEKGKGFAVRVSFPLQEQTWRYGGGRG